MNHLDPELNCILVTLPSTHSPVTDLRPGGPVVIVPQDQFFHELQCVLDGVNDRVGQHQVLL